MPSEAPCKKPVIIGAGPAGLSAAYELLQHGVLSEVLEADPLKVGGISRTSEYKGYRFDIGGHRFFSKNKEIEELWTLWLEDDLLKVARLSRILYRGKYFDYPLKASNAFRNLGLIETVHCLAYWLYSQWKPRRPEASFEDWVINRFGHRLYSIFFKTYTEKVWGMSCSDISADWAAQRIKNLNLFKAGLNALGLRWNKGETIKTLIDEFRYPRLGPGMMWERLASQLEKNDCPVRMDSKVDKIRWDRSGVTCVECRGQKIIGDFFLSSMPMRSLVRALEPAPPPEILEACESLSYRDYLTVVLVLDVADLFPDNWIYIHDPQVLVGRIQNYKNWSPEMVPEPRYTCLGMEYFCNVGDSLWGQSDSALVELGMKELQKIGLGTPDKLRDGTVMRVPKAYPVYDDKYQLCVQTIRGFVEENLPNLQLIGRNGMHKYNNQDHAMWTGILAARNALGLGEYNLWNVNADAEYLEESDGTDGRLVPRRLN